MRIRLALAASALAAICLPAAVSAQAGGTGGQKIQAKPGDLILVEHTDRVRVIRRSEAQVRAIYNAQQRWLVLLVDYASRGADPDGQVDASYRSPRAPLPPHLHRHELDRARRALHERLSRGQ